MEHLPVLDFERVPVWSSSEQSVCRLSISIVLDAVVLSIEHSIPFSGAVGDLQVVDSEDWPICCFVAHRRKSHEIQLLFESV